MRRILTVAAACALVLTGCSGADESTTPSASPTSPATATSSPSATPEPSASALALPQAFCDDAQQLYDRDLAISQALSGLDTSAMSAAQLADPQIYRLYIDSIDLNGWSSWRALYEQASADSDSPQMQQWISVIVAATDAQFTAYTQAAGSSSTLSEWFAQVSDIVAQQDPIEATGNEALLASDASLTECGVPLSVSAGEILGFYS
ncbi:hypothetical protein RN607_08030 [Demequina capsici]|uniref:Lipoprotein n=1 Tax=Demequina capsici TaxID=3075620 RepID=A0AA96FB54_9MICO|nr:hypothetical protein [Demequina sp. PMTSA13]WNM26147.1 hypothetical protein RN607_08030 [Demequina sp. PMTSA13]